MATRDTIVIGASAGGVQAITRLVADLPSDLAAAVFIVLHIPSYGTIAMPLRCFMARIPTVPSSRAPVRTTPITRGPAARAAERTREAKQNRAVAAICAAGTIPARHGIERRQPDDTRSTRPTKICLLIVTYKV